MYIKDKLTENDYQDIAKLMRSLMVKWKRKSNNKVVKEISMPDMIDILCNTQITSYNITWCIDDYWNRIMEERDEEIDSKIFEILKNNMPTIYELSNCGGFTQNELQWIINNYIKDIPVIYIKEEN